MYRLCDVLIFSNIVKNIEVNVFFKASLKHCIVKQKVRCFTRCFWVSKSPLREIIDLSQFLKELLQFWLNLLPKTSLICLVSTKASKTLRSMFFSKHRLKTASLRIWKHCIVKTLHRYEKWTNPYWHCVNPNRTFKCFDIYIATSSSSNWVKVYQIWKVEIF